jgi:hypothetical protein
MAVNLSPYGGVGAQFLDNSGNVLTGGKIFTYAAGTTTNQATYTTSAGNVPHSNPIILDASGRVPSGGEIWLTDGSAYKFILRDSNDVLIATYDNVTGINSNFVAFTNQQEIQTATAGQTVFNLTTMTYPPGTNSLSVFVDGVNQYGPGAQYAYLETDGDTVTFVNGLHVGALVKFTTSQLNSSGLQANAFQVSYTPPFTGSVGTNVGDKLAQYVSVKDFGAVGDGVTDDTAAMQAAVDAGQYEIDLVGGIYRITSVVTFDENNMIIKNGTLLFDGPNTARLAKITGDNVTFQNVVFDGNNLQPKSSLVYVEASTDRPVFNQCTFKNITGVYHGTTPLNQCYALLINPYAVTNFEVVNCLFKDLIKYNDGINTVPVTPAAVGLGFIGGICFMPDDLAVPTAAQPIPTVGLVTGCTFDNIQTILAAGLSIGDQADFNDADAIRTYGEPSGAEILSVHVADCIFRQCSKRAFKFRAAESIAHDCEIYAEGMQYGMIVPIDITDNIKIQNIKVFASTAKPVQSGVQWAPGPLVFNRETLVQGLFVSHCIVGVGFFSDGASKPLRNFVLRDIFINQASGGGIRQGSPAPSTQENIVIENVQIYGSGNNCTGVTISGASDNTSGVVMDNVKVVNGSFQVGGINNTISNVEVEISSSAFAGETTSQSLLRIGQNGSGGYQNVNNVFINAFNLNTAFSNATRQQLNLFIGDNGVFNNVRIKVPQGLDVTYAHADIYGRDMNFDGFQYDGAGRIHFGTLAPMTRGTILNATRMSNNASACVEAFLYTSNASTTEVALMNITDLRATTASSIIINAGTEFVVYNVASKTTNGTIVQGGGVTTTANINTF